MTETDAGLDINQSTSTMVISTIEETTSEQTEKTQSGLVIASNKIYISYNEQYIFAFN